MDRTFKVLVVCALGAFIGSVIALEVNPLLWWVGLIAGFVISYLSYDLPGVIGAIPEAWQRANGWRCDLDWRLLLFGWVAVFGVCLTATIGILSALMFALAEGIPSLKNLAYVNMGGAMAGLLLSFFVSSIELAEAKGHAQLRERTMADYREGLLGWNPVTVYCWRIPRALWRILGRVVARIIGCLPAARDAITRFVRVVGHFFRHLFILVHSDIRLLCGIDGAIGVIAGFRMGSPILGAAIGAVVGVLNYEVFSKRVFGLVNGD
jgi:hypothetical protein